MRSILMRWYWTENLDSDPLLSRNFFKHCFYCKRWRKCDVIFKRHIFTLQSKNELLVVSFRERENTVEAFMTRPTCQAVELIKARSSAHFEWKECLQVFQLIITLFLGQFFTFAAFNLAGFDSFGIILCIVSTHPLFTRIFNICTFFAF